jgi:hypothetical protein
MSGGERFGRRDEGGMGGGREGKLLRKGNCRERK